MVAHVFLPGERVFYDLARRFDSAGGGTERDLIVTADALGRAGHQVRIYAAEVRSPSRASAIAQVPAIGVPRTLGLLYFAWAGPALARREGAELTLSFVRAVGADILRSGGGAHVSYVRAARQWRGSLAADAMWIAPYHRAQMAIRRMGSQVPRCAR